MKRLLLCTVFVAALLLIAYRPVYPTKKIGPAAAAAIRKGKTTKYQVQALLGTPQFVERQVPLRRTPEAESLPEKYLASEQWTYWTYSRHGSATAKPGAKPARFFIVVFFDTQGTVLDCETELED
ncbi:MAG: hypothetical protein ABSA86_14190 [Oryzomonas sp.]